VRVDDSGAVKWTSVLGQSRTVTPYDYGMHLPDTDPAQVAAEEPPNDDPPPF
jgi:hypothetical protein